MKYIFIINPASKSYNLARAKLKEIKECCINRSLNFSIHCTQYKGHARDLLEKESSLSNEKIRAYALGGDGSLNEVALAAINKENIEVGVFPFGSGNDYIKSFYDSKDKFMDIEKMLDGKSIDVDVIKSNNNMYALNQCSIGIDAKVAQRMSQFKTIPMVSGPMAYNLALIKCAVFGKISSFMEVTIDDQYKFRGEFALALAANGKFYGGGYKASPEAEVNDGLLNFTLIRKMNKIKLAIALKDYKAGEYLMSKHFKNSLVYLKGKKMQLKSLKPVFVNYDGECEQITSITLEIQKSGLKFIIPE